MLCDEFFLPKQTVNSIIKTFCKDGLVELVEEAEDRRNKYLHITAKGRAFADEIYPQIEEAEARGIAQFTEEEVRIFFSMLHRYTSVFVKEMNS